MYFDSNTERDRYGYSYFMYPPLWIGDYPTFDSENIPGLDVFNLGEIVVDQDFRGIKMLIRSNGNFFFESRDSYEILKILNDICGIMEMHGIETTNVMYDHLIPCSLINEQFKYGIFKPVQTVEFLKKIRVLSADFDELIVDNHEILNDLTDLDGFKEIGSTSVDKMKDIIIEAENINRRQRTLLRRLLSAYTLLENDFLQESLVLYWSLAEQFLNKLWDLVISDKFSPDLQAISELKDVIDENIAKNIRRSIKNRTKKLKNYMISPIIETLEMIGLFDPKTFDFFDKMRILRNKIVHRSIYGIPHGFEITGVTDEEFVGYLSLRIRKLVMLLLKRELTLENVKLFLNENKEFFDWSGLTIG